MSLYSFQLFINNVRRLYLLIFVQPSCISSSIKRLTVKANRTHVSIYNDKKYIFSKNEISDCHVIDDLYDVGLEYFRT